MPQKPQHNDKNRRLNLIRRLGRTLHPGHSSGYPEEGIEAHQVKPPGAAEPAKKICIDYGPDGIEECTIDDVSAFFEKPRPECSNVRWIRVIGQPDTDFLNALATRYHFHPLALEDLIQVPQRPKVDEYSEDPDHTYLAVIASSPRRHEGVTSSQQVSIFAGPRLVVSFQEHEDSLVDRICERLQVDASRLRSTGGDFLMYCLLDQIIDRLFPILVALGDELEQLDEAVMEDPSTEHMRSIHAYKREMMMLRREVWPMREMLQSLRSMHPTANSIISDETQVYIRDVYDHCIHIVDMLETFRDAITSILDIHMNVMSNRMNEVMKVLTIIATIFIPLSFLSGVFGMNFNASLPGQESGWAFTVFVATCTFLGLGMVGVFWWRKWL